MVSRNFGSYERVRAKIARIGSTNGCRCTTSFGNLTYASLLAA